MMVKTQNGQFLYKSKIWEWRAITLPGAIRTVGKREASARHTQLRPDDHLCEEEICNSRKSHYQVSKYV